MPNIIHDDFFFFSLFGRAKETGDVHTRKVLPEAVLCSALLLGAQQWTLIDEDACAVYTRARRRRRRRRRAFFSSFKCRKKKKKKSHVALHLLYFSWAKETEKMGPPTAAAAVIWSLLTWSIHVWSQCRIYFYLEIQRPLPPPPPPSHLGYISLFDQINQLVFSLIQSTIEIF